MSTVMVLGGTGFLGYHTVVDLIEHGYKVKSLALPPMPEEGLFPEGVESVLADVNAMSDEEVLELLKGVDHFVYAIGADERVLPDAPAYRFFYEANVLPTQRLARLAAKAGVKDFVVYGSYFAEFAERMPDSGLKDQAYPATRLLQEQVAFAEGEGKMTVTSIRLPYIFGHMPGRMPLWKMFVDLVKDQDVYPVLEGGTAMVSAKQVAQATRGAIEFGEHRKTYAISGGNMKHKEFFELIVAALGQDTEIPVVPYESMKEHFIAADKQAAKDGKEHGIHIELSQKMSAEDLFIDPEDTIHDLKFELEDLITEVKATLAYIVDNYDKDLM